MIPKELPDLVGRLDFVRRLAYNALRQEYPSIGPMVPHAIDRVEGGL